MRVRGKHDLPDVLVVLTTQWRASAFGFAGDPNARTPHLDALAANSYWVKQAVTPHPFGGFARAAFLTGTCSPGNGVKDYYDPLPVGARTVAHAFGEAGYETAFFGKWQLHERDPSDPVVGEAHARVVVPPESRGGFDFWEGFESGFLLNDPFLHGSELPEPTRFQGYQSDVLVERFLRFRKSRSAGNPFFAVVSLEAPHPPYGASASGIEQPDPSAIRLQVGTTEDEALRATVRGELAGYYAHIEATDRAIGRLLTGAEVGAGCLLAFTSAHGDMHGLDGKFRKGWPDEGAVRVPLLLSGIRQGVDSELLMSLVDLGPSLLGLAGLGSALGGDGLDLSAALLGQGGGPAQQEISMPSVPPFEKQCPFSWTANRVANHTEVFPDGGESYTLEHSENWEFEA